MAETDIELARTATLGRRRQETKAALVAAAHHVFRERGYTATTVADIVERAESSRATFYLYFASKHEIFLATAQAFSTDLAEQFADLDGILRDGSRVELRAWLAHQVRWARENSQFYAVWRELEGVDAGAGVEVWRGTIADWLGRMPWLAGHHPEADAFTLLGLLVGQIQFFHHDVLAPAEIDRAIELLTDTWLTLLRPAAR